MNIYIVSLYPDRIIHYFSHGVLSRAIAQNLVQFHSVSLRSFGVGKHKTVDDYSYGGGPGMVLKVDVLSAAIESIPNFQDADIITFSPRGQLLSSAVQQLRNRSSDLILVCGSFEGIDERFFNLYNVYHVSLGDVVVSSGDAVAIPFLDAYIRRIPGVLGNEDSVLQESFENDRLEYPQYTQPRVFRNMEVPAILLSGHHGHINDWRCKQAFDQTVALRPDLLNYRNFSQNELKWMSELLEVNQDE